MGRKTSSVVDTGILISAVVFGGVPKQAMLKAINKTDIYVSPKILNEYREVPRYLLASGKINLLQFEALISGIAAFVAGSKVVYPDFSLNTLPGS